MEEEGIREYYSPTTLYGAPSNSMVIPVLKSLVDTWAALTTSDNCLPLTCTKIGRDEIIRTWSSFAVISRGSCLCCGPASHKSGSEWALAHCPHLPAVSIVSNSSRYRCYIPIDLKVNGAQKFAKLTAIACLPMLLFVVGPMRGELCLWNRNLGVKY